MGSKIDLHKYGHAGLERTRALTYNLFDSFDYFFMLVTVFSLLPILEVIILWISEKLVTRHLTLIQFKLKYI